jgi:hypothetical protein
MPVTGSYWFEFELSNFLGEGYEMFPGAEYDTSTKIPTSLAYSKFDLKIAVLNYFRIDTPLVHDMIPPDQWVYSDIDLSWADLVVVHFLDPLFHPYQTVFDQVAAAVNTQRLVFVMDGYNPGDNPEGVPADKFYTRAMTWFSQVTCGNEPGVIDKETPRPYLFECVWGQAIMPAWARRNRVYSYYMLQETGLIDQSLVSISGDGTGNYYWFEQSAPPELYAKYGKVTTYRTPELDNYESDEIKKVIGRDKGELNINYQYVPVSKDGFKFKTTFCNVVPHEIYRNTWYSIVCETSDFNRYHLTEKTAKCLWAGRVFILLASYRNLEYLRSFGFKTFHSSFIDESYDQEPNDAKRLKMAWEQIQRLSKMDPHIVYTYFEETLRHNQKVMLSFPQAQITRLNNFLQGAITKQLAEPRPTPPTDYFIWKPHGWYDLDSAGQQGVTMFPNAEVYTGESAPGPKEIDMRNDTRKKIAILRYESIPNWFTNQGKHGPGLLVDINLQWADLVIFQSTEPMQQWWPVVYGELCRHIHNDRIICVFNGQPTYTSAPPKLIHTQINTWFSYVVNENIYKDVTEQTVPFRKYMFDALIGTTKTGRLYLYYKLADSEFFDKVLINIQANPEGYDWSNIRNLDPVGYEKHGQVLDYATPGLDQLEEDVIVDFKSKATTPQERYSGNLLRIRNNNELREYPASVVVPWKIYQSSWYSIVCETSDTGYSTNFITEKTGKCLFAKRIFIMFAGAGLLKYLKSFGFQTFHGSIVDESYDNEVNDLKRFKMAWEQIERLYRTDPRDVYAQFKPVLDHNHELIKQISQQQTHELYNFIHQSLR